MNIPLHNDMVGRLREKIKKPNRGEDDFFFQCRAYQLPVPIRQFQYALEMGRKFSADFCFPEHHLLIEINGGLFMKHGAHGMPTAIERDMQKAQYAALLGYVLVPFTPDEVKSGRAIEWTTRILHKRGWKPIP